MGLFKKKDEMTPEQQALYDKKAKLIGRFSEAELKKLAKSNWTVGMYVSHCDDSKSSEAKSKFSMIYDIEKEQIKRGLTNSAHLKGTACDLIDAIFNIGDGNPPMPKLDKDDIKIDKDKSKEDVDAQFMGDLKGLNEMIRGKCEPQEATDFLKFLGGIGVNVAEVLAEETNQGGMMVSPVEAATLEKIFDTFQLEGPDRPPYKA